MAEARRASSDAQPVVHSRARRPGSGKPARGRGRSMRSVLLGIVAAGTLATSTLAALAAGDITVSGNRFLRDGTPWVAEGVTLTGLVAPAKEVVKKPLYAAAYKQYGPAIYTDIRNYGADLVRFQVSQPGLDPQSPIYDPAYKKTLLAAFAEARRQGFAVIVSMQAQGPSGLKDPVGMPNDATVRAWQQIIDPLANDRGVMLEVYNEPALMKVTPAAWESWRAGTQPVIDALRKAGSQNVLIVDGLRFGRTFEGAVALKDPLKQLAFGIDPYLSDTNQTRAQWDAHFGDYAKTHPVMATEFNSYASGPCRPELPAQTEDMLAYLAARKIGLVAWAFDYPTLRNPDGSLTTLDNLVCGLKKDGGQGGAGEMIHEYFLAH